MAAHLQVQQSAASSGSFGSYSRLFRKAAPTYCQLESFAGAPDEAGRHNTKHAERSFQTALDQAVAILSSWMLSDRLVFCSLRFWLLWLLCLLGFLAFGVCGFWVLWHPGFWPCMLLWLFDFYGFCCVLPLLGFLALLAF